MDIVWFETHTCYMQLFSELVANKMERVLRIVMTPLSTPTSIASNKHKHVVDEKSTTILATDIKL